MTKIVNGTTYHEDTPDAVINILETNRLARLAGHPERIKLHYGDPKTGRDWCEFYGVTGYVGRSTGTSKIPLLLAQRRSHGGPGILNHDIVRIRESSGARRVLYEHPDYHLPGPIAVEPETDSELLREGLQWRVYVGDTIMARAKTKRSADSLARNLS